MKKSYRGLVLWMLVFLVGFIPLMILKVDGALLTRLTLNYTCVMIAALAYIIYKFDRIYWYNGVYFNKAEEAGRRRRDAYALAHFEKFKKLVIFFGAYSILAHFINISIFIDVFVMTTATIVTAISTMKIKL
ncbi:MAG: hypothetical protein IKU54_07210 [Oscillospiraceae bacterium]|nr:hypothetical protein [Oscillospiraceae bacterium]